MLPASLAAVVPVFMATPTSAWARAGASLVPSPVMATSLPPSCSALISSILFSGVASARKSSTPASWAMAAAVSGLSPVIITVRMPAARSSAKRSLMPDLTTSLSSMTPRMVASSATTSGRRALPGRCGRRSPGSPSGAVPPWSTTHLRTASAAPLRIWRPSTLRPDMRVVAENGTNSWGPESSRSRMPKRSLASTTMERPSGVSSASDASWAALGDLLLGVAAGREEVRGHAVAERDGARLVEQQGLHVPRRLDGAAAHGQHVALHQAVHAGDADGGEQRADGGRDEADQQRDQDHHGDGGPGVASRRAAARPRRGGR